MIWKKKGDKPAARRALNILLENDGKVLFEVSTAEMSKPIVIGRGAECDWCTSGIDASVSGRHAEIYLRRGTPHIRDLGSRNGIYHHGQRVQDVRLAPGETILIGACSLSVERPAQGAPSDGRPHHHRLEQLNGPDAGRMVDLVGPADIRIGSSPTCSIVCLDTLVSHEHAVITFKQDGSCWVSDLGSRNGSAVNGLPLKKERMLLDGDILKIAYIEFRFHDKNVVHANANIGRKMAVIATTTAVVLMLFFLYNAITPSARTYLEAARKCAAEERFGEAFENLDKAAVARYSGAYGKNIRELRSNVESWTNTLSNWRTVQSLLANKKWVSARELFHNMNDWRWNNVDAPVEMEKAGRMERLVGAFLDSRIILQEKTWTDDIPSKFARQTGELRKAVAAVGAQPGKYAGPLADNAADVLRELEATLADFRAIAELQRMLDGAEFDLERLANPVGKAALADLSALMAGNAARRRTRVAQSEASNLAFCRFSEIPGQRMAALRDVVEKYAAAEQTLLGNMARYAGERYGDVVRELTLPTTEVCGKFGVSGYRDRLEKANETLVNRGGGLKTQMDNLRKAGFDFDRGLVAADFKELLAPETARAALRFVSPEDTPARIDSPEPVCPYDKLVGVFAFSEFLSQLTEDGEGIEDTVFNYGGEEIGAKWTPLLRRGRDAYEVIARFLRTISDDRSGFLGKIATLPLPEGENRVKLAVAFANAQRMAYQDWRADVFPSLCEEDDSPRALILSQGVSLILSDHPSKLVAATLFVKWRDFRRGVPKEVHGGLQEWGGIMAADVPGKGPFMRMWKDAHEALARKKAEGGAE